MTILRPLFSFSLLCVLISAAAMAEDARDAVRTGDTAPVVSSNGNCVRTQWQADSDICAPAKEIVVETPPPPPPVVKREEISQDKRTVYFDFNKSKLRPDSVKTLDELVTLIKGNGQVTQFTAHGFADQIGQDKYNDVLSQKRADAVQKYLAGKLDIPSNSDVKGLGESRTAECDQYKKNRAKRIECLAPDRRVEVELTYRK